MTYYVTMLLEIPDDRSRTRKTTRAPLSRAAFGKPQPIPVGTWSI
jgi:hypothetical protein